MKIPIFSLVFYIVSRMRTFLGKFKFSRNFKNAADKWPLPFQENFSTEICPSSVLYNFSQKKEKEKYIVTRLQQQ